MIHDMIMAAAGVGGPAGPTDADFENTVLLLHGDGTNGAQNNTFLDSSTNNFTITRNGNTTQGSFSPFSKPDGRWGNYFDGSGDYLSVADNAALQWGTGDFCVEAWVNPSDLSVIRDIVCKGTNNAGSFEIAIETSKVALYSTTRLFISTASISTNSWTHIAVTRSGTTVRCFINGALDTTITSSADFNNAGVFYVGVYGNASSNPFSGYISNVRCVKGSAVYTSAFTPSTSPLTAISGTSLLTCQSNRFKDNSTNNFTITRNGDVKVTPFSPFPLTTAYDPAVNGGSGYFDGSGDYLSVPDNAALEIPTQDFTIEAWVYLSSLPASGSQYTIIQKGRTGTSNFEYSFEIDNNSGSMRLVCRTTANGTTLSTANGSTISLVAGSWNHVAVTRTSTTASFWFNGVAAGTGTVNGTTYTGSAVVAIGANDAAGSPLVGYMASFRFVKGSRVYTSAFTPPTAPLTAIANTSLLCNFTNAGVLDNTGFNNLETVGNAQIDTTVKKYGTGSMEFDGSGDWLVMRDTPEMILGTGDFTIEMWVNVNGAQGSFILDFRPSGTNGVYVCLYVTSATFRLFVSSADQITSSSINYNQWYHLALTRSGTSTKMFLDGVQTGSTYTDSNNYLVGSMRPIIATSGSSPGGAGNAFNGYIDDLRITKGIARYTTTFTPPTAAFPDVGE